MKVLGSMMSKNVVLKPGVVNAYVPRAKKLIKRHLISMGKGSLAKKITSGNKYGPAAVEGVKLIQKKHGLDVDGVVGPKTWSILEKTSAPASPFKVISREAWQALPPKSREKTSWGGYTTVYLHHTVTKAPDENASVEEEKACMRELQKIAFSRGFSDISYSYIIFKSGRVYEGRGFEVVGAHTYGHNTDIGVAFPGNYGKEDFVTKKQKSSLLKLRRRLGVLQGPLRAHCSVYNTSCPGENIKDAFGLSC